MLPNSLRHNENTAISSYKFTFQPQILLVSSSLRQWREISTMAQFIRYLSFEMLQRKWCDDNLKIMQDKTCGDFNAAFQGSTFCLQKLVQLSEPD